MLFTQKEIILFETEDKSVVLPVAVENETVWLSLEQMAELFQRDQSVIGKHIRNIFSEGELVKESVWANSVLKQYIVKGYAVNNNRIKQLGEVIRIMKRPKGNEATYVLTYEECRDVIATMRFGDVSDLFGKEKDDSFKGSIGNIYQSFAGQEIYESLEEKEMMISVIINIYSGNHN